MSASQLNPPFSQKFASPSTASLKRWRSLPTMSFQRRTVECSGRHIMIASFPAGWEYFQLLDFPYASWK